MMEHTNNSENSCSIYTDKKLKKEANTQYLGPIFFFKPSLMIKVDYFLFCIHIYLKDHVRKKNTF